MAWFYPVKTGITFFDVWTIFHLAFWLFAGSCFWAFHMTQLRAVAVGLVLAFGWEAFERYAEKRWPAVWLSPESWLNAWVSDPLTCLVGVAAAYYALDNWR